MYDETRLDELRRQRALVEAHLEWLDREIEAASGQFARVGKSPEAKPSVPSTVAAPALGTLTSTLAPIEPLFGEQPRPAGEVRQDVKKGCLLYFAAAIAAVIATVAILYFAFGVGRR